jgi:hypothetical protein
VRGAGVVGGQGAGGRGGGANEEACGHIGRTSQKIIANTDNCFNFSKLHCMSTSLETEAGTRLYDLDGCILETSIIGGRLVTVFAYFLVGIM